MSASTAIKPGPRRAAQSGRSTDAQLEVEAVQAKALLSYGPAEVELMDDDHLQGLKVLLQHGSGLAEWETPSAWFPMGTPGKLSIDLKALILRAMPEKLRESFVAEATVISDGKRAPAKGARFDRGRGKLLDFAAGKIVRYLVLCRMGPAAANRKRLYDSLDPSTLIGAARGPLPRLAAKALERKLAKEKIPDTNFAAPLFAYLQRSDFANLSKEAAKELHGEIDRMFMLNERGMWHDIVRPDEPAQRVTTVSGPELKPEMQSKGDPHKPLPDDYVAEMGAHAHWIAEEFAPSLLRVAEEVRDLWDRTEHLPITASAVGQRRDDAIRALLEKTSWTNSQGQPLAPPPFRSRHAKWWPLRNFRDFIYAMRLVQMAHFFVVGMSMAARTSELATMRRDCVRYTKAGEPLTSGRTWKLVELHEGVERDWALPGFAAQCIEQQVRLVALIEQIGKQPPDRSRTAQERLPGKHLWASIGGAKADCTKQLVHVANAIRWFADALGMSKSPGGQGIRVHRFRKTIARLAALAMTEAPKVLMDVFGHKSIEMTLYYILTDVQLQIDIETVVRELRIMKMTEAIESVVAQEDSPVVQLPGYGGPAAVVLGQSVRVYRQRLHRTGEEWGASSARELAEIMTLQGRVVQMVRRGVFCTKFPGTEAGPCNRSKGAPEPARCQTHCTHRLEEPFLRQDVDESIGDCVSHYEQAKAKLDELSQVFWAEQIRVHLPRFADVQEKWKGEAIIMEMLKVAANGHATTEPV